MLARHRAPFPGLDSLQTNYSQSWQDMFILSMLHGKRDGTFLEIGAQAPVANNNTFLLSHHFNWRGVSVELDPIHTRDWQRYRPDDFILITDALKLNYNEVFESLFSSEPKRLDYLQLDIDPSFNTLQVLKLLPLDCWRFNIITFETDAYSGDLRARDESRELLHRHGYALWAPDVKVLFPPVSPEPIPFEDWWVASELLPGLPAQLSPQPDWDGLPSTLLLKS